MWTRNIFSVFQYIFLVAMIALLRSNSSAIEVQKSIHKRFVKTLKSHSSPLTQNWYRVKQQHVSKAQKRAITLYWESSGITLQFNQTLNLLDIFKNEYKYFSLDIGFGMGESILDNAYKNPLNAYIGVELHKSGIGNALLGIHSTNRTFSYNNVKLIRSDVSNLISSHIADESFNEVSIYFPDPWPNIERDENRRVFRPHILGILSKKLKDGGVLRVSTDVREYAKYISETILAMQYKAWICTSLIMHEPCVLGPSYRPITKYERRAAELKNLVWDFEFKLHKEADDV